jgi:hypothetical protein
MDENTIRKLGAGDSIRFIDGNIGKILNVDTDKRRIEFQYNEPIILPLAAPKEGDDRSLSAVIDLSEVQGMTEPDVPEPPYTQPKSNSWRTGFKLPEISYMEQKQTIVICDWADLVSAVRYIEGT